MALHSHPSRTPSSDCLLAANANTARPPPPAAASRFPARPVRAGNSRGDLSFYPGEARSLTAPLLQLPGRLKSCHQPRGAARRKRLPAAARGFGKAPSHPARPDPRPEGSSPWGRALEPPRSPRAVWKK